MISMASVTSVKDRKTAELVQTSFHVNSFNSLGQHTHMLVNAHTTRTHSSMHTDIPINVRTAHIIPYMHSTHLSMHTQHTLINADNAYTLFGVSVLCIVLIYHSYLMDHSDIPFGMSF